MEPKELRTQGMQQLRDLVRATASKIRELRFTVSTRQQGHVRQLRSAKRDLARVNTVLREKANEETAS